MAPICLQERGTFRWYDNSDPDMSLCVLDSWCVVTNRIALFADPLHIHRQSCYLFGRDRKVVDVPTDHPSCSKQHAVLQFRLTQKTTPDGDVIEGIRPYVMDLGSTNGTFLNVRLSRTLFLFQQTEPLLCA